MIDEQKWDELQKRFTPSSLREGELDFISEISSYEYDFVVFLSNKCFLSSILSAKTMNKDLLDKKNILTQSSFFQHIGKLAEYYIKHNQFPKILLVDDLMYRGKTLNIFLSRIQDALFNEVNKLNPNISKEYDKFSLNSELKNNIKIKVLAKTELKDIVLYTYIDCLHQETDISKREYHKVLSDKMLMLSMSDSLNSNYMYSVKLDKNKFEEIKKDNELIETNYFGNKEYTYSSVSSNRNGEVYFIYTLRFIKVGESDNYRASAFIFTPTLNCETRISLLNEIRSRIEKNNDYDNLNVLSSEVSTSCKRSQDEWISLLLSNTILSEFCKKYNIDMVDEDEIKKLCHNYSGMDSYDAIKKNIISSVKNPIFKSLNEEKEYLEKLVIGNEPIIKCNKDNKAIGNKGICEKLEKLYYVRQINELIKINESIKNRNIMVLGEFCDKTQFPICLPIRYACENGTVEDVKIAAAYLLQMMDVGIHELYAEDTRCESDKLYNMYFKIKDMALLIYPMQLYPEIDIISAIYEQARISNFDKYIDSYSKSELCSIKNKIEQIKEYNKCLSKIGENPYVYQDSYFYRMNEFEIDNAENNRKLLQKLTNYRENLKNNFDTYKSNK